MRLINNIEAGAYYIDLYRIVPRVLVLGYGWMSYMVVTWFMTLKDPTVAQAGFPAVVFGVIPLVMNFYMQNGINWEERRKLDSAGSMPQATA